MWLFCLHDPGQIRYRASDQCAFDLYPPKSNSWLRPWVRCQTKVTCRHLLRDNSGEARRIFDKIKYIPRLDELIVRFRRLIVECSGSHGCGDACARLYDSEQCYCNAGRTFNNYSTSTCAGQSNLVYWLRSLNNHHFSAIIYFWL